MDVEECKQKGFIRKTQPNRALVKSLIEMANGKEIAIQRAQYDEVTVSAYVSLAYDSLRESLEALCILYEYKVTSHICLGELLRTLKSDFKYHEFDRLRYIRNGINYYGEKIELMQGKEIIRKTLQMKQEILKDIKAGWNLP